PAVVISAEFCVNALPQSSVAVAISNEGVAGHFIVTVSLHGSLPSSVMSCTLIVCVAVELLPQPSVAVQVLVTLYDPAHAPAVVISAEVSVNVLPQASVAVAIANEGVAGQLMVDVAGSGSITGAVMSC